MMADETSTDRVYEDLKEPSEGQSQTSLDAIYENTQKPSEDKVKGAASGLRQLLVLGIICVLLVVSISIIIWISVEMKKQEVALREQTEKMTNLENLTEQLSRERNQLNQMLEIIMFDNFTVINFCPNKRSLATKSLVFPHETDTSYVVLTPQKPLNLTAFTLCMQVATELKGQREIILFAYRTLNFDELNVWRELDGTLSLYLSGSGVLFQVPELGALQTHLCVTWESSSGATALFMNGIKSLTKIYKTGHTVSPGGTVLVGQDPDSYLGSFNVKQSFVGEISDVDMWDFVLSNGEVQDLFSGTEIQRGNLINWETTQLIPYGDVNIINYVL